MFYFMTMGYRLMYGSMQSYVAYNYTTPNALTYS